MIAFSQSKRSLPSDGQLHKSTASCETALAVGADRAAAAAGQGGLMSLYDSMFHMMDMQAAQVLVTSKEFDDPEFRRNLSVTVDDLLAANVVPVFNENDAISSRPQNVRLASGSSLPPGSKQDGLQVPPCIANFPKDGSRRVLADDFS